LSLAHAEGLLAMALSRRLAQKRPPTDRGLIMAAKSPWRVERSGSVRRWVQANLA